MSNHWAPITSFPTPTPPPPQRSARSRPTSCAFALDAVSEESSAVCILDALSTEPALHKEVVTLLPLPDAVSTRADVANVSLRMIVVLSLLAKEDVNVWGHSIPALPKNYTFSVRSYELLERLLSERKIRCQKIRLMGGLERVAEGMKEMREGRVRAEKVVFRPLETNI